EHDAGSVHDAALEPDAASEHDATSQHDAGSWHGGSTPDGGSSSDAGNLNCTADSIARGVAQNLALFGEDALVVVSKPSNSTGTIDSAHDDTPGPPPHTILVPQASDLYLFYADPQSSAAFSNPITVGWYDCASGRSHFEPADWSFTFLPA